MIGTKAYLFASGDLRIAANKTCWPAQENLEKKLVAALSRFGMEVVRGHPYKADVAHGFLASQREGMDAFADIDTDAPVIVAIAAWQYSHHVLPGLTTHKGPILTIANWSGQWPGLVGMLNLNGSLTKAGVNYTSLWSETLEDEFFLNGLQEWVESGQVAHDTSHVRPFDTSSVPAELDRIAERIAADLRKNKTILGVFDEGCMGMFNAIVPDHLMMPMGMFKERLSQSTLYYETMQVPVEEGETILAWLRGRGMSFHIGTDPETELTEEQLVDQCRMYVAAVRLADRFGCEAIGIQYQQGLKDLLPASDLAEGLLNNDDRPPVSRGDGSIIRDGQTIVHFNEVDECAGIDGILTNRIHRALGQPVETTLHDLRWGADDPDTGRFTWVFEISGAAPPAHHVDGYKGTDSQRQPAMYFRLGGGTVRGIAKPGDIVWSRIFVAENALHMDIGVGEAVRLSQAEVDRRRKETSPQWPIMNAVLKGVTRDQMMARHKANHIHVAYAKTAEEALNAAIAKAALASKLGVNVHWCG